MAVDNSLYSDSLVDITEDSILFKTYYFPFGSKRVRHTDIADVVALEPTLGNGRYRIHGTGDLRTWFAGDWRRPSRAVIFLASLRDTPRRIGFTVEDADKVERILQNKHLLRRTAPA